MDLFLYDRDLRHERVKELLALDKFCKIQRGNTQI